MIVTYLEEQARGIDRFDLVRFRDCAFDESEAEHDELYFQSNSRSISAPADWLPGAAWRPESLEIDWSRLVEEDLPARPVDFLHECERDFADALDAYAVRWRYKPRTFAIEWDEDGNFVDSFTPGFYLPRRDLYCDVATPRSELSRGHARSVRLLRQHYPAIRIELICGVDYRNVVAAIARS